MGRAILILCVGSALLLASRDASAVIVKYGTAGDNTIIIGCVSTDGQAARVRWCRDGSYEVLANNCSLADSVWLYGDQGDDYMYIVRSTVTLTCGNDTRQWTAMTYGTHYIDLYGEEDDDDLIGGDVDTYLTGSTGNDFMKNWAPEGVTTGSSNNDRVMSIADSDGDGVSGGSGNDCVDDRSGAWLSFSCGSGTDHWYDGGAAGSPDASCEAFYQQYYCCDPVFCEDPSGPQGGDSLAADRE